HTRWPRDWSSDVCSSDLPSPPPSSGPGNPPPPGSGLGNPAPPAADTYDMLVWMTMSADLSANHHMAGTANPLYTSILSDRFFWRSEERRVGKEWRCVGAA